MHASFITYCISSFHEYTVWLPFNMMNGNLRSQSGIFDLFMYRDNVAMAIYKANISRQNLLLNIEVVQYLSLLLRM